MEFDSSNGRDDGEHSSVGVVEISKIFTMHDNFFFGVILFGRVLLIPHLAGMPQITATRWRLMAVSGCADTKFPC